MEDKRTGKTSAAGAGANGKASPAAERYQALLEQVLRAMRADYPSREIVLSQWNHEKYDKALQSLCGHLGFARGRDFFEAYGFRVVDDLQEAPAAVRTPVTKSVASSVQAETIAPQAHTGKTASAPLRESSRSNGELAGVASAGRSAANTMQEPEAAEEETRRPRDRQEERRKPLEKRVELEYEEEEPEYEQEEHDKKHTLARVLIPVVLVILLLAGGFPIWKFVLGNRSEEPLDTTPTVVNPGTVEIVVAGEAPAAETVEQGQLVDESETLALYGEVLARYKAIADGSATVDDFTHDGMSYERADMAPVEAEGVSNLCRWEKNVGYQLLDVDGDGTKELWIGSLMSSGDDYNDAIIFDMYSLISGKPARLFVSGERYRYVMLNDGSFYFEGSSSAAETVCQRYTYDGLAMICEGDVPEAEVAACRANVKLPQLTPIA